MSIDGPGNAPSRNDPPTQRRRRPPRTRRRRTRRRTIPPEVAEVDEIEDGHERVIDPREAGAQIVEDHGLDMELMDLDALKVLRRLTRHGFQSYLVGGCVRDLLVGRVPKDFDVATSATPRQIRRLFRNSRIIGRRFRLAHVHFGSNIIEVSTFRRSAVETADGDDPLIRRDNLFGCADEDARRRDFTINALFFDIHNREVIDFVGGMKDLREGVIRTIGEPVTRLREDPVRMLRAAKFAGRLGFTLSPDLMEAIRETREDLSKASPPRLYEEIRNLLQRGSARGAFSVLHETRVLEVFLPEIWEIIEGNETCRKIFWSVLRSLDQHVIEGRFVSPPVQLAALFFPLFGDGLDFEGGASSGSRSAPMDIGIVADRVMDPLAARLQMPRRDLYAIKQALVGLRRLLATKRGRRRPTPNQIVRKDYFPNALRLFALYARAVGRHQGEVLSWVERYESVTGFDFD